MNPSERCLRSRFVTLAAFVLLLPMFLIQSSTAQKSRVVRKTNGRRDSQIGKVVSEINPKNIERTIRKLVSFGTRNTLSDQNDPNRGIGAARDWLYSEFQKAAAASAGRMTIEISSNDFTLRQYPSKA